MKKIFLFLILFLFFTGRTLWALGAIVFNGAGATAHDKLVALTLAGIVNRSEPRLYLLNVYETWSYNQTDEKWMAIYQADGGVAFSTISNINDLVQFFSQDIKGAITYDANLFYSNFEGQSFRWQAEFAAMLGGLTDCIPVAYDNTSIAVARPDFIMVPDHFNGQPSIEVSARLELASHGWNDPSLTSEERYFKILDWGLEKLLPRCNPAKFYLREITDWAVNQRMFQMNLAGTDALKFTSLSDEKASRIEKVFNYLKINRSEEIFHVYGWMRPEPLVQWISAHGGSFHETLLSNLSWHHVFPVDGDFHYHRPSEVVASMPLEDKYYVLIIASEGDAGNWVVGFQGGAWQSSLRGQIPVGWGVNLQMFNEFPFVAQYYYRTASANDGFMAVSTPLGYAYPDLFPEQCMDDAILKTKQLANQFHVSSVYGYKHYNGAGVSNYRGITISNWFDFYKLGSFSEAVGSQLTFTFDPKLTTQQYYRNYGGLLFNHVDDDTFYSDFSNLTNVSNRIVGKLSGKSRPYFLLGGYQRFRQDGTTVGATNKSDVTLPRLKTIMDYVKSDPVVGQYVEFVTPEKFTYLMRKKLGLPTSTETVDAHQNKLLIFKDRMGDFQLNVTLNEPQNLDVRVFDLTGNLLHQSRFEMLMGSDYKVIPMKNFQQGIYIVSVTGYNVLLQQKISK